MQPQRYHLSRLGLLAFIRSRPTQRIVTPLIAAGIWLLSVSADGATLRTDSSNPRYFNNGAGIVFLTGSYWVNTLEDDSYPGLFDYADYLIFLVANGHNFIRMINIDCPHVKTLNNPASDVSPLPFQRP